MNAASLTAYLQAARAEVYALGAFNAVNLETAQAIVGAAEAELALVILQISENAARYGGLRPLFALCAALKSDAKIPAYLHDDHAESLESAVAAVELAVMPEGADLGLEANTKQLRQVIEVAHDRGVAVEGEFEIVSKNGRESTRLGPGLLHNLADTSGCDFIVVDLGSVHKLTQKSARLDLGRLGALAKLIKQPLVLHGSSGVDIDDLRKAISLGIAKVNVATALTYTFTLSARESLTDDIHDPRRY